MRNERIEVETFILEAFDKIRPGFKKQPLRKHLATMSSEENTRLYNDMLRILTRAEESGGYGYTEQCAKEMIEIFCAL